MERDELIAELEAIMPIVNKWERLSNLIAQNQRSINELNFNIRNEEPTFSNIMAMAFISILCCFSFDGIVFLMIKLSSSIKITFLFYFVFSSILAIILTIVFVARGKRNAAIRRNTLFHIQEKHEDLKRQFANEVTANLPDIYAIIPQNYAYPNVIKQLYSYLKEHRADTLKEAINLYEEKPKTDALKKQLAQIQKTQAEIKQQADEAKSLAARTLFWTMYNNHKH